MVLGSYPSMHATPCVGQGEIFSGAGQDPNQALWGNKAFYSSCLEPMQIIFGLCARSVTTEVFGREAIFLFRVFDIYISFKSAVVVHVLIIAKTSYILGLQ
jgi:hypothetical protein